MTPNASPPTRSPRWASALRAGVLIAYPVIEIFLLFWVGGFIGWWWTLGIFTATAVLGGWLLARQGRKTWAAYRDVATGRREPGDELLNVLLVMVGGILLILPGYIGDVIGLIALLPFTRPPLAKVMSFLFDRWLRRKGVDVTRVKMAAVSDTVIVGETVPGTDNAQEGPSESKAPPGDNPDDHIVIRGEIEP